MSAPCVGPVMLGDDPLSSRIFAHCAPFIQAALDRDYGSHSVADVRTAICSGAAQLWVTPRSALVTAIENTPQKRMLFFWLSGGDLEELRAVEATVCSWAKVQGCDQAWISGRRGWLRALDGYREGPTMMLKEL